MANNGNNDKGQREITTDNDGNDNDAITINAER